MSSLKMRISPVLLAALGVVAAIGGAWRLGP